MKNIIPYNLFEMARYDNLYLHKCFIDIVDRVNFDIANNSVGIDVDEEDELHIGAGENDYNGGLISDLDLEQIDGFLSLTNAVIYLNKKSPTVPIKKKYEYCVHIEIRYDPRNSSSFSYVTNFRRQLNTWTYLYRNKKEIYLRNLVNTDKIVNDFYDFCNDCIKEAHKIKQNIE
jgi:hypothetical protein